jgi:hypothetical protein
MLHSHWPPARGRLTVLALAALVSLASPAAWAQTPASGQAPPSDQTGPALDAGQAAAAVPALVYRSALQTYRPWREQSLGDWRALNAQANRVGGWRSYLREVHQAPATPAAQPTTPGLAANPNMPPPATTPAPVSSPVVAPKAHPHAHH